MEEVRVAKLGEEVPEEEEEEVILPYESRTDDELRKIAKQIYRNEIFCTWHVRESDIELMPNIFMPLVFMSQAYIDWMDENKITFIYAIYSESLPAPMAINGYPIFFAMNMLNKEDEERLREFYNTILDVMGEKEEENER